MNQLIKEVQEYLKGDKPYSDKWTEIETSIGLTVKVKLSLDEFGWEMTEHLGTFTDSPKGDVWGDRMTGELLTHGDSLPDVPEGWQEDDYEDGYLVVDTRTSEAFFYVEDGNDIALGKLIDGKTDTADHRAEPIPDTISLPPDDFPDVGTDEENLAAALDVARQYLIKLNEWCKVHNKNGEKILSSDGPAKYSRGDYRYYELGAGDQEYAVQDWKRLEAFNDDRWSFFTPEVKVYQGHVLVFEGYAPSVELGDGGYKDECSWVAESVGECLCEMDEDYIQRQITAAHERIELMNRLAGVLA